MHARTHALIPSPRSPPRSPPPTTAKQPHPCLLLSFFLRAKPTRNNHKTTTPVTPTCCILLPIQYDDRLSYHTHLQVPPTRRLHGIYRIISRSTVLLTAWQAREISSVTSTVKSKKVGGVVPFLPAFRTLDGTNKWENATNFASSDGRQRGRLAPPANQPKLPKNHTTPAMQ